MKNIFILGLMSLSFFYAGCSNNLQTDEQQTDLQTQEILQFVTSVNYKLSPVEKESIAFTHDVINVFVDDQDLLYLAGYTNGVEIVKNEDNNVSEFSLLQHIDTVGLVQDVVKNGEYIYVAAQEGGLLIYSFNADQPQEQVELKDNVKFNAGAVDIEVLDKTHIAVAYGEKGVLFFSVDTTNGKLKLLQTIEIDGYAKSLYKKDNLLYVSNELGGALAFDISDLKDITLVAEYLSDKPTQAVIEFDNNVALANKDGGISLYDKTTAELLTTLTTNHEALDLKYYYSAKSKRKFLLVADNISGLTIVNLKDQSVMQLRESVSTGGTNDKFATKIFLKENLAYIADGKNGLRVIDLDKIIFDVDKAYLVDSSVSGVFYHCGDLNGTTDGNGTFFYLESQCNDIEFFVGGISLGKVSTNQIRYNQKVLPANLLGIDESNTTEKRLQNLIQFLQTMDEDGNPDNGIIISNTTANMLLTQNSDEINVSQLAQVVGKEPVPIEYALAHYEENLRFMFNIDVDTVPPKPAYSLESTIYTNSDSVWCTIIGERGAEVFINGEDFNTTIDLNRTAQLLLPTPGDQYQFTFDITLKDSSGNFSDSFYVTIYKNLTSLLDEQAQSTSVYNYPPIFTNNKIVDVYEGETQVVVLSAKDVENDTVTFSIEGEDASDFNVNATNGEVTFKEKPLYSEKQTYHFTAVASDDYNSSSVEMIVNILKPDSSLNYRTPFEIAKLSSNEDGAYFGSSIAIDGDYIVIGASRENNGSVYLYYRDVNDTVTQLFQLQPDGNTSVNFGNSVAIDGDYIVIGDSGENNNSGSVFVFKKESDSNITQLEKLMADDAEEDDYFGGSVAIDGDYIVVGAYKENNNTGAAYIFKKESDSNITQLTKLTAEDAEEDDYFGASVAIDGDYIVIGATGEDEQGDDAGAAYIFKKESDTNITQLAKFVSDDIDSNDAFGSSVAIDGDSIVVGASDKSSNGSSGVGSAYVFKQENKKVVQLAKLQPEDLDASSHFGKSVAIDGEYIVVGAYYAKETVYIFKQGDNDIVSQIGILKSSNAGNLERFGFSVAISNEHIIVGAYESKNSYNNYPTGAAYLFSANPLQRGYIIGDSFPTSISVNESLDVKELFHFQGATPNGEIVYYNISGEDSELFNIQNNVLKLNKGLDYEQPEDANGDNNYTFKITLEDESGHSYSLGNTNITIKNKEFLSLNSKAIAADDAKDYDYFGRSISIDGDYIVVGGEGHSSAYIFQKGNDKKVTQLAKLTADDVEVSDSFGQSVSIDGEYIVIGADHEDEKGDDAGAVYIFKRESDSNITQLEKLMADDAEEDDNFGRSVAIDGEYIVVGAYGEDEKGDDAGAVYIFKRESDSNITQLAKLTADDTEDYDNFGDSVAIDGEYIVVGAYREDEKGDDAGAVYIFKRESDSNITQLAKLTADDAEDYDYFGRSVAIDGEYIVIGANGVDNMGRNSVGSAYIFQNEEDTFKQIDKLEAYDAEDYDYFGKSVAIDGENIAIGAYGIDDYRGGFYVYEKDQ